METVRVKDIRRILATTPASRPCYLCIGDRQGSRLYARLHKIPQIRRRPFRRP